MRIFGYQWPLVLWRTHDRVVTENHDLRNVLVNTQKELRKYKLLVANLRSADQATEQAFARARDAVKQGKA